MPLRNPDSSSHYRRASSRVHEPLWRNIRSRLFEGPGEEFLERLPFVGGDATGGSETELHAAVQGTPTDVELPRRIAASNFLANLRRRSEARDTPRKPLYDLERVIGVGAEHTSATWDNSWVRIGYALLGQTARGVLRRDLLRDKSDVSLGWREDIAKFLTGDPDNPSESSQVCVPVSYLLKLSLADFLGESRYLSASVAQRSMELLDHFLNDNCSPETHSFWIGSASQERTLGEDLARETSLRFLMSQLLVEYANNRFGLIASGQRAKLSFLPHPPQQQKELNECISDEFYRDLFTSPCLSGWDRGEDKSQYMRLCHLVLSRSRLRAMAKVRDAGLIATNLILLPTFSNTSLSNNGIHVSLGSKRLTQLLADENSGFGRAEEKYLGDLVIKLMEHFLPLFVGTYSAAPFRFDYSDFHAEEVLGFLPHELDFTHLRMFWRRWKRKAAVRRFGTAIGATGYAAIDKMLSRALVLRGDFVPDHRLIDYLVAPLSTAQSPALSGQLGNCETLVHDLADQGEYDHRMAFYSLMRQRAAAVVGYSGFEARFFSLCPSFSQDLGKAADLQQLLLAAAFYLIARGELTHADIPDDPEIESERRQIFFGSAAGIPTFFVRSDTTNRFLARLLRRTQGIRASRRYRGYHRVPHQSYRIALIEFLREAAAPVIDVMRANELLDDLSLRVEYPAKHGAAGRMTKRVLDSVGARKPHAVRAADFNNALEQICREDLRKTQMEEAFSHLQQARQEGVVPLPSQRGITTDEASFERARDGMLADRAGLADIEQLLSAILLYVDHNRNLASA